MSILSYKYKAHKLVNTLFYVVVFGIGFVLGFGAEKIDFNKLVSQVLMIDNAKAYNITSTINEDYIVEKFSQDEDFDITIYKNIFCLYSTKFTSDQYCYAFTDDALSKTTFSYSTSGYIDIRLQKQYIYNISPSPTMRLNLYDNTITKQNLYNNDIWITQKYSSYKNYWYFSFIPDGFNESSWFGTRHLLDFSKYMEVDYWLNDGSIFKDEEHQDFKEVCWENFDELMFSVTISSDKEYDVTYHEGQQEGETYIDSGFYVFDDVRKLKRGTRIKTLLQPDYKHDSSTWVSGVTFEHLHNITSEFYLMNKDELLESRYSDPVNALGNYDISRGDSYYYDNLSKLLNATYVGFTYYKNVIDDYRYDIFYLQEEKEKFCIYIPNDFIVTTLSINELGGIYGDVPTHTDKSDTYIDMESVHNNNFSYNSLFSVIKEFIASIRETVSLINGYIYSLFTSFPPLLQMFIITIITLIVIKTILWMVVR